MTTVSGSCICKAIKVTATGEPKKVVVCYCNMCRKLSGEYGQVVAIYPSENVTVEDPGNKCKSYDGAIADSGKPNVVKFCGDCSVNFFTVPMVLDGKVIALRPTTLDEGYDKLIPTETSYSQAKCPYFDQAVKL